MRSQTLPDGMSWEDCRKCGGLTIITPSLSVNGGSYGFCFECMKTSRDRAERESVAARDIAGRLGAVWVGTSVVAIPEATGIWRVLRHDKTGWQHVWNGDRAHWPSKDAACDGAREEATRECPPVSPPFGAAMHGLNPPLESGPSVSPARKVKE